MGAVLNEMKKENRQAEKIHDEFTGKLSRMEELGWEDAGAGEEQSQNYPEFCGDINARQCPAVDAAAVANDILRLLSRLEGGTPEQTMDSTTRRYHGDRKRISREREKKISMGHRADDHEEQGQKMM